MLIDSAITEREHFARSITGNCQRWIRASTAYPTETHLRFSRHSTNSEHPEGCKQEACLSINHLGLHGDRYRNPFDPLAGLEEISARSVRIPSSILPGFSAIFPCSISPTLNTNKPRLHNNATIWAYSGYSTDHFLGRYRLLLRQTIISSEKINTLTNRPTLSIHQPNSTQVISKHFPIV